MEKLDKLSSSTHENSTDNINRLPYRWQGGMHVSQLQPSIVHKKHASNLFLKGRVVLYPLRQLYPSTIFKDDYLQLAAKKKYSAKAQTGLSDSRLCRFALRSDWYIFGCVTLRNIQPPWKIIYGFSVPQKIRVYKVLICTLSAM